MSKRGRIVLAVLAILCAWDLPPGQEAAEAAGSDRYEDLAKLFEEWRAFQKPRVSNGVPDYTAPAMEGLKQELRGFQNRLAAIDYRSWPVSRQIDHHLVRAEMNGLDFDHRVLRPWSRNPCFYTVVHASESDTPAREGPALEGAIELWRHGFPLPAAEVAPFKTKLQAIPKILEQARRNLVEDARDLWLLGIRVQKDQGVVLADLATRLAPHHPDLLPDAERARQAVDDFRAWLEVKQRGMTAPSGVGIDNYNWYLRSVHLVPYTWQDEVTLMQRELGRALAHLKLEQSRNRSLSRLEPILSAGEWERRFDHAVTEFMTFLREKEILTVTDAMDPALRARGGPFVPPEDRDFFAQVDYRDPLVMRCHGSHWFDKARMERQPHPSAIRRVPLLYNIWDGRAEGLATAMEEMMMSAGLFEGRPRTRELVYILVANRAARALAGLKMQSNEFSVEQAVRFAHEWTPNGWLREHGDLAWDEQQLYLEQPGYGTSYLTGKAQIEKLLADRSHQIGESYTLKQFMDEFHASGMIPVSLIRWELTGKDDEVRRLQQDAAAR